MARASIQRLSMPKQLQTAFSYRLLACARLYNFNMRAARAQISSFLPQKLKF